MTGIGLFTSCLCCPSSCQCQERDLLVQSTWSANCHGKGCAHCTGGSIIPCGTGAATARSPGVPAPGASLVLALLNLLDREVQLTSEPQCWFGWVQPSAGKQAASLGSWLACRRGRQHLCCPPCLAFSAKERARSSFWGCPAWDRERSCQVGLAELPACHLGKGPSCTVPLPGWQPSTYYQTTATTAPDVVDSV